MSVLRLFYDPRGRIGRGPLWAMLALRTCLGVGLITLDVADRGWDDAYRFAFGLILFWPYRVALPLKRLRDLGYGLRELLTAWTALGVLTVMVLEAFARVLRRPLLDVAVDAFDGTPVRVNLETVVETSPILAATAALLATALFVFYAALYLMPGRSARSVAEAF